MKGAEAEARAAQYLSGLGRQVLARNYRIRGGEIDLVSRDPAGVLHFTEVRQRTRSSFGSALESVTPRKYELMLRAAQSYLLRELGTLEVACRLEVLSIDGPAESGALLLTPLD